jgi:hypothetical protein
MRVQPPELGTAETRNWPAAIQPPHPHRIVGHKAFIIWLDARRYIAVEFTTVHGEVVFFLVRLMTCSRDGDRILSRFDTAHGIAHQDLLTASGNLREKRWLPELDFNAALKHAIDHFKTRHEDYTG